MAQRKTAGRKSLAKKIIAIFSVLTISVTGGILAKNVIANYKSQTPQSVSDNNDVNNGNDGETTEETTEETFSFENILYEPYSIKNDEELKKVIKAVEDLTKIDLDYRYVKNMYYDFLGNDNVLTANSFSMTSDEWSEWYYDNQDEYYNTLDYGIGIYASLKNAILDGEDDEVINKYKSELPSKITGSITLAPKEAKGYKTYELKLEKLIDKELTDIKTGNTKDFEKTADDFLKLIQEVRKDGTISDGERFAILQHGKATHPLFSRILEKTHPKENAVLKDEFQGNMATTMYTSSLTRYGYSLDPKTGEPCTKKREGEEYKPEDAARASTRGTGTTNRVPGKTVKSDEKHSTSREKVETATTATSTTNYVVTVPDDNKEQTTGKKPGGKTTGTTSTSTETTSHLYDFDVQPGVEYSDDSVNEKSKTLTP